MDLNEQTIIGTVGQDPVEVESTKATISKFSVATNNVYKGEKTTNWNNIVTFGKTAETCKNYIKKGSKVYVQGRVQETKYRKEGEDTDRIKREIVASKVIILSSKGYTAPASDSGVPF